MPQPIADSASSPSISSSDPSRETWSPPVADRTSRDDDNADGLIGVSLDSAMKAQEFLLSLSRLSATGEIRLRDAVVVVKDHDGKVRVRETLDPQPGRAAFSGAMWSGLLGLILGGPVGWITGLGVGAGVGAITARVVDFGVPDEWVNWFKEAVRPDTATVVALAGNINLSALRAEARRFPGADLVHTTFSPDMQQSLARAFESPGQDMAPMSSAPVPKADTRD
jgi:uncharacterized membrane protein